MSLALFGLLAVGVVVALVLQRTLTDGVTFASLYAFVLFIIPSRYVIGPLGGTATPAILVGLGAMMLWVLSTLHPPSRPAREPNPMRTALLAMLGFVVVSAGTGLLRSLDEFETSGATAALVLLLAGLGIALLICDTTDSLDRLEVLVDRLVLVGSVAAVYGLVQFATSFDPGTLLSAEPLLTQAKGDADFTRVVFNRPAGPALHPIAFAVSMSALLPLAIHRLLHRPDASAVARILPLLLIGAAVPLALSRSGFVASAVGVGTLWLAWDPQRKVTALLYGGVALASTVFVPGLAGTLRGLFLGVSDDPSIQARVDDLPYVVDLVAESPIVGRGFGTYTAAGYRLLDNAFYGALIEVGFLGVAVYTAVLLVAIRAARAPHRAAAPEQLQHLGQALMGTFLAVTSSAFTFDTFFYRTTTGLLMLSFGMTAVVWRLSSQHDLTRSRSATPARGIDAAAG